MDGTCQIQLLDQFVKPQLESAEKTNFCSIYCLVPPIPPFPWVIEAQDTLRADITELGYNHGQCPIRGYFLKWRFLNCFRLTSSLSLSIDGKLSDKPSLWLDIVVFWIYNSTHAAAEDSSEVSRPASSSETAWGLRSIVNSMTFKSRTRTVCPMKCDAIHSVPTSTKLDVISYLPSKEGADIAIEVGWGLIQWSLESKAVHVALPSSEISRARITRYAQSQGFLSWIQYDQLASSQCTLSEFGGTRTLLPYCTDYEHIPAYPHTDSQGAIQKEVNSPKMHRRSAFLGLFRFALRFIARDKRLSGLSFLAAWQGMIPTIGV